MRKSRKWIIALVVVLLCVVMFLTIKWFHSPEYAIARIVADVQSDGIDGLMPHLTEDAAHTVNSVKKIVENPIVSGLTNLLAEDKVSFLKENIKDISWDVSDLLKGKNETDIVLGFKYRTIISGSIKIILIDEDGEWKIDGISVPSFD